VQLPINFINGYLREYTRKFADELRVRLIDLFKSLPARYSPKDIFLYIESEVKGDTGLVQQPDRSWFAKNAHTIYPYLLNEAAMRRKKP
jgi:hypothetical protein